jgi:hypothetical protein
MDIYNLNDLDTRLNIEAVRSSSTVAQDSMKFAITHSLRFLANCVLRPSNAKKFPTLVEKVHGRIIDAFPKCDPDKPVEEWSAFEEHVILASRGMLKSTIGAAWLTQAILCAPDMRALIISGKIDKSQSILDIARKPFLTNEVIRFLFPEWAIDDSSMTAEAFTTPRRNLEIDYRDPTLAVASFDSVKAGWHGDFVLLDDATNEQNSNNIENCEKTHGSYDETDELVEPGMSKRIFLGTKWHEEDLPAYIVKKGQEEFDKSGEQTCNLFVLPAWTLRTDGTVSEIDTRKEREKNGILTKDDVNLAWPEKLSARFLFKIYHKNREDFYKQYLLDASLETPKAFTEEVMNLQSVESAEWRKIPLHDRAVVIHWDMGSVWSKRQVIGETDYSCGIVACFQKSTQKCFVTQSVLAKFAKGEDMVSAIVKLYMQAMPIGQIIAHSAEDAVGVRNIDGYVTAMAKKECLIDFVPLNFILPQKGQSTVGNLKNVNIAMLASAMTGPINKATKKLEPGFVFLSKEMNHYDEIRAQFEKWSVDAKRRKDDGPDCIAQVWKHYRDVINSDAVQVMESDGPILSWEPEPPPEVYNPHADETGADAEYLESDTTHFFA